MFRRFVAFLILGVAVTALTVQAEQGPAPKLASPETADAASKRLVDDQMKLMRQYKAVAEKLLILAQQFEKSSRLEDQEKAKLIRKALKLGDDESVENKFQTILRTMAGKDGIDLGGVTDAKNQSEELSRILKEILSILKSDDELLRNKEEKDRLEKQLAELKNIIRATQVARAISDANKGDHKKQAEAQAKIKEKTDNLAKRMEGKDPSDKKNDAKDGMGEPKDGKGKDGMGEPKDGKGGKGKDGMGEPKDGKGGKGKDGMGEPKDGKGGKGGEPKDGMGGMGKDGMGGGDPPPPAPPGPKSPGADQVKKAVPDQEQARKKIEENKRPEAVPEQTKAIEKLIEAQKELEKRLKQLREEELERLLANLEARVAKMLQMQIEVYESTKAIDGIVQKSESKKPEKAEIQKSQVQADRETEIIAEANKTIEILKQEGSAVAFPRVFEETVIDMTRVRERLNQARVAKDTQLMEQDIIDSLKEMLEALKKAQQDLQQSKGSPPPPGAGGPPPEQKLLDEIAELKMLRNLQMKVNDRTKRQGNEVKDAAEQTNDPQIKVELKDLANRQVKIEEMARDIATGKNK